MGEHSQAIGRSRGGRTTKIHALSDEHCRPVAFLLTGGQVADCTAADMLLGAITQTRLVHGDKGYDTNTVRQKIEAKGAAPNIPPKRNRVWKNCFSPVLYRNRNAIERMFGRLKDSAGSPQNTTKSQKPSMQPFASPLSSATGYESGA